MFFVWTSCSYYSVFLALFPTGSPSLRKAEYAGICSVESGWFLYKPVCQGFRIITDTINTSGLGGNQTINLLAGKASSFGTIAKNTTIENAISGAGNDTLIGNNSNNVLTGNAGNDTFISSKGLDYIQGGAGLDTLEVNAALSWGDSLTAVKQSATTVNLVSEITGLKQ